MESEIFEQVKIIPYILMKYINPQTGEIKIELPSHIRKIVIVASGSSYHCARFAVDLVEKISKIETRAIYSSEFLFVWFYFAKKDIAITLSMFLRDVLPYMLLSAIVMYVAHLATVSVDDVFFRLVLKIVVSALLYLTVAIMMRSNELKEITEFLSKRN